ncbi:MAG TPA: hypothetical protein VK928_00910 [Longimicrobiales bacterium]|nr:hypothetical protein [Longimicrobiales bacterium]
MILPHIRSSFGRSDAQFVVWLLSRGSESAREREEERFREQGFDAVLDDPLTLNALLAGRDFSSARPELVFYVLVRHALLEDGINDRGLADYLAALVLTFGREGRAYHIADDTTQYRYLVDIAAAGDGSTGRRAFLLRAHLGEFALWLSGLFPDHITARVHRRAAPPLAYYEAMGTTGYRLAARYTDAEQAGIAELYRNCADFFPALRIALNRVADRHLFPVTGDRIDRMLRQVADSFRAESFRAEGGA